jgi:hypothetical protein
MALNISDRVPSAGWKQACFRSLQDDFGCFLENLSDGLVDKHGHAVSGLSSLLTFAIVTAIPTALHRDLSGR